MQRRSMSLISGDYCLLCYIKCERFFYSCQQDEHLDRFLNLCHAAETQKLPAQIRENSLEEELKLAIQNVPESRPGPCVQFLTLIFNKLLSLLVRPPVIAGQTCKWTKIDLKELNSATCIVRHYIYIYCFHIF